MRLELKVRQADAKVRAAAEDMLTLAARDWFEHPERAAAAELKALRILADLGDDR